MCLSKLRKSRPGAILSIEEGKFYWMQILRGVVCLHALKPPIVHKDIKAGNVLLTCKTEAGLFSARLADFEYAVVLDEEVETEKLRPCGTPFFVAPEVINVYLHCKNAYYRAIGLLTECEVYYMAFGLSSLFLALWSSSDVAFTLPQRLLVLLHVYTR